MSKTDKHIFLVRHAKPLYPGNDPLFIGHTDLPLSDEGIEQARLLSEKLMCIPFDQAYSSDLLRASMTAETILEGRSLPISEMSELRGRSVPYTELAALRNIDSGIYSGRSIYEIRDLYPEEERKRLADRFNYRIPGGESYADLEKRVIPVFEEIALSATGNTLMVCHGGVIKVILKHILGLSEDKMFLLEQCHCGVNIISIHPVHGISLKAINHLDFMYGIPNIL